jgi:hypothetical protein
MWTIHVEVMPYTELTRKYLLAFHSPISKIVCYIGTNPMNYIQPILTFPISFAHWCFFFSFYTQKGTSKKYMLHIGC